MSNYNSQRKCFEMKRIAKSQPMSKKMFRDFQSLVVLSAVKFTTGNGMIANIEKIMSALRHSNLISRIENIETCIDKLIFLGFIVKENDFFKINEGLWPAEADEFVDKFFVNA